VERIIKRRFTKSTIRIKYQLLDIVKEKYPTIEKLIGHYEYRDLEDSKYWLELDSSYRQKRETQGKNL